MTITEELIEFLTEELAVRRNSAEPSPTEDEAKDIAQAEWAIFTTKNLIAKSVEFQESMRLVGEGKKQLVMFGSYGCLTDDCDHWDDGTCSTKAPYCRIGRVRDCK